MDDDVEITGAAAEKILKEARERFKLAIEAESENRKEAEDDLRFLAGEQWTDEATKVRKNRPCLTINRLPQYVRQVVNEQRKTRPSIDVIPADGKAAKPTADVIQGLVRYIERTSRAQIAYDTAFSYAVACSIGHFRVCTDYVDEAAFEQEIQIKRIENVFNVYRDPHSCEPDHCDDEYTFVTELVDPDDFKSKYGFEPTKFDDAGQGDDIADWFDDKMVRVAEYWRVVKTEDEAHALSTGEVIEGSLSKDERAKIKSAGVQIVATRKTEKRTVEQYLLTFDKVIKKSKWLGTYIPIVTSTGEEWNIGGKRKLISLIRFAKDPARMYNYMASAETELVALQPKAPWIAPEGSFEGHENQWSRANQDNLPYLEYVPVDGQPGPARQFFSGTPSGVREGRMAAAEDIKATLGMYDASLGARSNETSGVAIRERRQEGDTGTYHFIANHARAIEQCGRIIIDLIPKIYDTPRAVRILSPTDEESLTQINAVFIDPATGEEHLHDMSAGKYAVAVRVGPSFESKRQEMVEAVIELSNKHPRLLEVAGDLIVKNMDWPQSEEIAKRLFTLLPPQLRGEQSGPPENPLVQAEQIKQQGKMQEMQLDMQAEQAKMAQAAQFKQQELAANLELQRSNDERQAQLEIQKFALERERMDREFAFRRWQVEYEASIELHKAQMTAQANAMRPGMVNMDHMEQQQ